VIPCADESITSLSSMKTIFIEFIHDLQDRICTALEAQDQKSTFREDTWTRLGGGGGKTRVIADGSVFEKGGVNTSVVHGVLPELIRERFGVEQGYFLAAGLSLVIHPVNPHVPTVHANYRYFELYDREGGDVVDSWFGGGADLTPYYLIEADAHHFHRVHKQACDGVHSDLYATFKSDCDHYFHNTHRGELRGIGGIFYDYMRGAVVGDGTKGRRTGEGYPDLSVNQLMDLARRNGQAFIDAYLPIVASNKSKSWTDEQRYWQEIRRGRYVEFNLIHDRGTLFGLKTDGRVESILMSLPPRVRWDYDFQVSIDSPEASLLHVLKAPRNWID
jgi:coproporphyrinogen III oxidase